jgi:ssDNA-binding Zn-finger/Zn-ribbon topoisomerase 1
MVTLQCCKCGHIWQREGRRFGYASGMPCPKCGSKSVERTGKRRGKWRRKTSPCDDYVQARLESEEVWHRTAARGQAHKGKGPRS